MNEANGHSLLQAGLETKGKETVPRYASISLGSTSAFLLHQPRSLPAIGKTTW
jgi:hypothetical protein